MEESDLVEWAKYYESMGMTEEAAKMKNRIKKRHAEQ